MRVVCVVRAAKAGERQFRGSMRLALPWDGTSHLHIDAGAAPGCLGSTGMWGFGHARRQDLGINTVSMRWTFAFLVATSPHTIDAESFTSKEVPDPAVVTCPP